jgi:hypothetical protein
MNTILIRSGEHSQTLRVYPSDVEPLANEALALSVLAGTAHRNPMAAALDLLTAYARYEPTTNQSAFDNALAAVCFWLAKQVLSAEEYRQLISGLSNAGRVDGDQP